MADDRLYRSTTDRSLSGVCGGLAAWLGIDPSLIRIAWVILAIVSGGVFVILYIIMAIVVPEAPPGWAPRGLVAHGGPPPNWDPRYRSDSWGTSAPGGAWTGSATGWQGGAPGVAEAPAGDAGGQAPGPTPSSWPEDWGRAHAGQGRGSLDAERGGIVVGGVLIALGAWFLVKDYVAINWDLVWPVAVIALGGLLIAGAMRRGR